MAVCKGRGDHIKHKVKHTCIAHPYIFFTCHSNCSTIIKYTWLLSSVWPVQNIACLSRDPVTSSVRNSFKGQIQTGRS